MNTSQGEANPKSSPYFEKLRTIRTSFHERTSWWLRHVDWSVIRDGETRNKKVAQNMCDTYFIYPKKLENLIEQFYKIFWENIMQLFQYIRHGRVKKYNFEIKKFKKITITKSFLSRSLQEDPRSRKKMWSSLQGWEKMGFHPCTSGLQFVQLV